MLKDTAVFDVVGWLQRYALQVYDGLFPPLPAAIDKIRSAQHVS